MPRLPYGIKVVKTYTNPDAPPLEPAETIHPEADRLWKEWNRMSVEGRRAFAIRFLRNVTLTAALKWWQAD